jgi:4-amino-4-deoxychorismate lyase
VSRTVLAVLSPDGPALADPEAPLLRADDPGVLRGESVFETVRVAGGRPAFLDRHLLRLQRSADRLELALPAGWEELSAYAVDAWGEPDGVLRLVCSRGGVAFALVTPVPEETVRGREQGVSAMTLTLGVPAGLRTGAPWLLGGVKSTSYAVNMAALRVAADAGVQDAVFVSTDGEVLEAPTATCAWLRGGRLVTPPPEGVAILPGTTMDVVLELCAELGVPYEVRRGSVEELRGADEVLLTGSIRGVAPVVELDGRVLGVGEVTRALRDAFEQRVQAQPVRGT